MTITTATTTTARSLMVLGTASHVGKSLLVAALCRILVQEGFSVAPFKAQNMALNSAATPDGQEIGRAQALQAEAAGIAPTVDMNPVLIKPSSDTGAQVVVRGRVWGQVTASDYHQRRVAELFPVVVESYRRLAARHDIIILEGAGSPAEINLKSGDIVNMRMAEAADARCLLIGDIDRGGVFASLLGTLELLEPEERARIRGFVINKFRGDESLLRPGINMIEERIRSRCVGVIPFLPEINLDEEDSVALEDRTTPHKSASRMWHTKAYKAEEDEPERPLRIGVILLPHLSNFTDFDALAVEPSVSLAYITCPAEIQKADVVILPGTKQTTDDLRWLRDKGFDTALHSHAQQNLTVGICGGMQMLGRQVCDPGGLEGGGRSEGLSLLPISTVLASDKVTQRAAARLINARLFGQEMICDKALGYEIHLGTTQYGAEAVPLMRLTREGSSSSSSNGEAHHQTHPQTHPQAHHEAATDVTDGAVSRDERTIGTYLHGLFDADDFRHAFLRAARAACRLAPPCSLAAVTAERQQRLDRLATHVRQSLDLETIFNWLEMPHRFKSKSS